MANLNASISPSSNNHNHEDSNNNILQQTVHNIQPGVQGMHNLSVMQGYTNQGNHSCTASTRNNSSSTSNNRDPYLVRMPASLPGIRCYTDASTSPDLPSNLSRDAGIGIFIVNNQVHPVQTIYIKAAMKETSSVLMAEAAALALTATVAKHLHLHQVSFLSDN